MTENQKRERMGIFNKLIGGENRDKGTAKAVTWTLLETQTQLEELIRRSEDRTQLLFKNSTTCGISSIVRRSLESNLSGYEREADLSLLNVQYNRGLSDAIAETFGVRHETPQLLVIRDGRLVSHASHGGITAIDLQDYL